MMSFHTLISYQGSATHPAEHSESRFPRDSLEVDEEAVAKAQAQVQLEAQVERSETMHLQHSDHQT